MVAPDRSAAGSQDGRLVGVASLECPGLQAHQACWLAGATSHLTRPERAARLGLAVAVATRWLLSVGGEAEETIPASTVPDLTALVPPPRRRRRATPRRRMRVFRRGGTLMRVALLDQAPLPLGRLVPAPWTAVSPWEAQTPLLPDMEMPLAA